MDSLGSRSPLLLFVLVHSLAALAAAQPVTSRTFTLDGDFDQGLLLNLHHNFPNNNQLQVGSGATPFPYLNVLGDGAYIVRVNVNTGQPVGFYHTAPWGMGRYAWPMTTDRMGNIWAMNCKEYGLVDGQVRGSVVRMGLVIGGTRVDQSGNPSAGGLFLKPPFQYNTCVDRNNDGLIKTSDGTTPLPWDNQGGADTLGGVSTAEDECIISYTRTYAVGNDNAQGLLVADLAGDVWVGGPNLDRRHEKLNGGTGQPVSGTQFSGGYGGLGGIVDRGQNIWFMMPITRLTPSATPPPAGTFQNFHYSEYPWAVTWGIAVDPLTGNLWVPGGPVIYEVNVNGTVLATNPAYFGHVGRVVPDGNGDVWVPGWHHVARYRRNPNNLSELQKLGEVLVIPDNPPVGVDREGIGVDSNGKIWAMYHAGSLARIDPTLGSVGEVDLRVYLPLGNITGGSDPTGSKIFAALGTSGIWNVVHDSGAPGTEWGRLSWNASVPPGAGLTARVRAAGDRAQLGKQAFISVTDNGSVCGMGVAGRYLEVQVSLNKAPGGTTSPVLYDLTLSGCAPPQADLALAMTDSPDPVRAGSNLSYTLSVTNQGPAAATGVTVTDTLPAGVSLVSATATQGACAGSSAIICSPGGLSSGATVTVTLVVRPAAAGSLINTAAVSAAEPDPNPSNNSATATTTVSPLREITSLSPARLWVGLKNSDDQGTPFDLRAELYRNGALIASGVTQCVTGVTRNPSLALEAVVPYGALVSGALEIGDQLALKVLTRIGTNPDGTRCAGHASAAGLRLHYDAVSRASRFGAAIAPDPLKDYFLHSNAALRYLDPLAPAGTTAKSIDSAGVKYTGGNPWVDVGSWSMNVP